MEFLTQELVLGLLMVSNGLFVVSLAVGLLKFNK